MALAIASEVAPLKTDADGVVWEGATPVTLETLVAMCKQGVTAEEIADRYPLEFG